MGWKDRKWKLNIKGSKDKWLIMLAVGLIFLILGFPAGKSGEYESELDNDFPISESSGSKKTQGDNGGLKGQGEGGTEDVQASGKASLTYEQQLEQRLEQVLSHVDGVGSVEVMIVLKSTEEKVWRVDRDTSYSVTQETDQNGGSRKVESQEIGEDTILAGQTGQQQPILEKELKPEINGVIVSAEGGGSPQIQAEISAAVEALFGIPSHKIKVLKRIE